MSNAATRKRGAPTSPVAAVIYVIAAALIALPVYEWITNVRWVYQSGGDPATMLLNAPARLFALVGFVLMFYQFVLGIRLPLFEKVFPRATNLKRHRSIGKVGFLLILLHGVLMLAYDYTLAGQLIFDTYRVIGMVALGLLILAACAAWFFKQLKLSRKTWKTIHLLGYVVFPLGFEHARNLGTEFATGQWTVRLLFNTLIIVYVLLVVYRIFSLLVPVPAGTKRGPAK